MEAEPVVEKQLSGVGQLLIGWNLEERLVLRMLLVRGWYV
jgi:hypothetical protein